MKLAIANGVKKIEASQNIFDYFYPQGVGPSETFFHGGVRVYPKGRMQEIDEREAKPLDAKLHSDTGFIEGRT